MTWPSANHLIRDDHHTPMFFVETPWWYDDHTQLAYAFSTEDLPVISQANVGWLVPRQGASWQCFRYACGAEPWFHHGFAWLLMFHPPFREIWWQEQQLPLSVGRPRCATASQPCGIRTPRGCGSACGRWGWGRQWKWWADVKVFFDQFSFLLWEKYGKINEHQEAWTKINETCDWISRNWHVNKRKIMAAWNTEYWRQS